MRRVLSEVAKKIGVQLPDLPIPCLVDIQTPHEKVLDPPKNIPKTPNLKRYSPGHLGLLVGGVNPI